VNSPPPKPEVILTNFFTESTVLLVPITSRASANTIVDGKLIENLYFYCEVFNLLSTKLMFFFSFA
jgi:hypothetical protein